MLKLKPFKQSEGMCGPACFKMVMDYYGFEQPEDYWKKVTEKEFTNKQTGERKIGYFDDKFVEVAENLGHKGFCKDNSTMEEVRSYVGEGVPVIVDWCSPEEGSHFSVAVGFGGDKIYLADPHFGEVKEYELSWFMERWSDHGLVPEDYPSNDPGWVHRICVVYPKR